VRARGPQCNTPTQALGSSAARGDGDHVGYHVAPELRAAQPPYLAYAKDELRATHVQALGSGAVRGDGDHVGCHVAPELRAEPLPRLAPDGTRLALCALASDGTRLALCALWKSSGGASVMSSASSLQARGASDGVVDRRFVVARGFLQDPTVHIVAVENQVMKLTNWDSFCGLKLIEVCRESLTAVM
jgi:hypothetical protein